jgi:cation-transporting ATPase 13A2
VQFLFQVGPILSSDGFVSLCRQLLVTEVFKPFFLFQLFSIIFWICTSYEVYAYVILTLTTVTVLYNVLETRQNLLAIKKLATSKCEMKRLTLMADENAQLRLRPILVSSSELLPGDIVQVEAGMIFPCDLVLLAGQCVVNESMLTGESAPVPKTPLPLGLSSSGQVKPIPLQFLTVLGIKKFGSSPFDFL